MIAIIAGTGSLPLQACKSLLADKKDFFIISLFPEDNLVALLNAVPDSVLIVQKPFYKARTILDSLKEQHAKQVLFIGKVDKRKLLKKCRLDFFAIKMLATLATKSDMSIMNKISSIARDHGIEVLKQNEVLSNLFVSSGVLVGKLSSAMQESITMGLAVAAQMSVIDVGQTVVVKDKMVLAVEAIEGTDACIKRGVMLGKSGVVVCKTANVSHNKKFDLPTIGSATLANVKPGEIAAIAWQSNQTFIADKEAFCARARELGITLVSV